ncbi:MFS transporter [Comamonas serinivorans]|uniref:MFS transporter n=1 Tax=Comamonas serinivorans TaxID=1082851 RepID=A0A1Y0ENW0_9BURK|nr:MFS transporter [Comamonas serinivorans]ARU05307.1 MFS transporter [Comamonas serinivorans]
MVEHTGAVPKAGLRQAPFGGFYGWVVVAAVFMVTLVGFGCAYSFGSFIAVLQGEFGASRGSVSLVFSIAGCLYFGLGVVSGPMADRWGARGVTAAGMALVALGMVAASRAQSIGQVYWAYGIGIGLGVGLSYVPGLGAVQRWFLKRRGFASGLAVSGIGVGTLLVPPLAAGLIEWLGWRQAYLVLGAGALVLGLGAALLIADDPHAYGTGPDGEPATPASVTPQGLSLREAMVTPRFIWLYAACSVAAFGIFVPFVHLVPHALDQGVPAHDAVLLLGVVGVGSTLGRFFLGALADRFGRDRFLMAMSLGVAVALALWAVSHGFWALALVAAVFGVFYGGWVAVIPAVTAEHFGGRHVGSIIGVLYTSVALGTLLGPTAVGYAFDATHSYVWPIAISAASTALAAALAWVSSRTVSPMAALQHAASDA